MEDLEIGLIAAMSCILFMSLFGNIILLVVVHGQLPYQAIRNYSYLILNLAISDILLASSSIPFDIVQRLKAPVFPFGPTMCKLLWPFQTICSMASIFTVGALSYQRYRLVVRPFNGKLPRRRFLIMLASIWLLPVFLAGLPYSFVLRLDQNSSSCIEEWIPASRQAQVKLSFTTYLFIIQYVLPLALIVWCNVKAIVELKSSSRYLKYRKRTSMISALSIEHHENTVKMLTAIMAVFALFWLPGQVMAFLLEFENENEFILNYGLDIGYLFVFTNCVMNPLIFAYFSQCHKNFPVLRRLTASSINPTIACELGYSTFRRDSERRDSNQQRRGSLPGNLKRVPLARTLKRPSLPSILQRESITEVQRKDLLQAGRNKDFITSKRNSSILPQKKQLPVLAEMQNSDTISLMQTKDLPQENQNSAQPTKTQKRDSLVEMPKSDVISSMQNGDLPHSIQNSDLTQKRGSIPGSRKKLSFSLTSLTTENNNSIPNTLQQPKTQTGDFSKERHERPQIQKRSSFSILKKRDSIPGTQRDSVRGIHSEKHGDVDAGNRVMRNFLEIMKTMKEDVLRKYLDATPETVLN